VLVAVLVFVVGMSRPWGFGADYWALAATIREASAHPLNPSDPIIADLPASATVRFTPYTLALGLFHRYSGLSLLTVTALAGAANVLLLATGLYLLTTALFGNRWMPVWALFCYLFLWGHIRMYANEPGLGILTYIACYWGTFGLAVVILALYCVVVFIQRGSPKAWLGYLLLMSTVAIVHTLSASWGMVVGTVVALSLTRINLNRFAALQGGNILALCAPFIWPYFAFKQYLLKPLGIALPVGAALDHHLLKQTKSAPRRQPERWTIWGTVIVVTLLGIVSLVYYRTPAHHPLYHIQLKVLGPALLGVPAVVFFALRGKHVWLFWSLAATLVIYFLGIVVDIGLLSRYVMYAGLLMQLAVAAWLCLELPGYLRRGRWQNVRRLAHAVGGRRLAMLGVARLSSARKVAEGGLARHCCAGAGLRSAVASA